MKKVLLVAPVPPPYGGIANWTAMINEYVEKNKTIEFCSVNTAPKRRSLDGRSLFERIVVDGFKMFKKKKEVKRLIKSENPIAVHITTSGQFAVIRDILILKAIRKIKNRPKTVYHIRFGRIPEIAKLNTREWKLIKRALTLADEIIAIDHSTEQVIKQFLPDVKVQYIPNPFDLKKLNELDIQPNQTKKEVLFLGWVVKTKGIEELLSAWQNIKSDYDDWQLRIIGPYSPNYVDELGKKFSLETVVFDGEKKHDESMQLLAQTGIFVLPSYTEGFPNVVLEAMALSKPIVATKVGAIPDMIEDGCGCLINSKSSQEIEMALSKLMDDRDLSIQMGIKARSKLERDYTLERVFEQYLSVWNG